MTFTKSIIFLFWTTFHVFWPFQHVLCASSVARTEAQSFNLPFSIFQTVSLARLERNQKQDAKKVILQVSYNTFPILESYDEYVLQYIEESGFQDIDFEETYFGENGVLCAIMDHSNEEELIGTCGFKRIDHATCELRRMFLKLEHHDRGIGKAAIEFLIGLARQKGYKEIRREHQRLRDQKKEVQAVQAYEALGFKKTNCWDGAGDGTCLLLSFLP